ncbi:uncharacterized protein LOC142182544 [Nicotiana tabacum]|uniref:Uncharacterized protein LOC142182544 n=2 Tax=Nicotiana TaxID=4085 RepID=A0AC58UTQ1_TOBAC|nr:PREDICTED: uncharacterized protein LOC104232739 [Nicotiana sylvestris]
MRVHPMSMKRNIAIREGIYPGSGSGSDQREQLLAVMEGNPTKKLRKLPHVFGKVLELPFRSDADVAVEEGPEFFRFVAEMEFDDGGESGGAGAGGGLRVQAVEIHPGITKIVVRNGAGDGGAGVFSGGEDELLLEELKVDTWRFRLPATTKPELATAVFVDGELIVTVPKVDRGGVDFADGKNVWGGGGRVVLVQ